ncbi:MAG: peptidylprolyl isomerase [Bryobacteraceae bacterium]|jgi:parvulin-like peptidyl-prolyl isomerase
MRVFLFSTFLFTAAAWAQSAAPQNAPPAKPPVLSPDTVVATFGNGQKLTVGELKNFISAMPPQMQQSALRDRKGFVQQFALMHRLAEMAEQAKLDQSSPTKESLAFSRMYLLMNAQIHEAMNGFQASSADMDAYYKKNQDRFSQVKVKAIYISFSADPSKETGADGEKRRTEAEAQAKIEKLHAQIAAGADFVKLVKENSEDQTSAAKDGDFGTIRRTDNLPDAIRNTIFALKTGETSWPVKQPHGFYLFHADEVTAQPLSEVQEQILNELKQAQFNEWMEQIKTSLNLKYENETFFAGGAESATASK